MAATTTTSSILPHRMRKTLLGYVPVTSPFYIFHPITRLVIFVFFGVIPIFIDIPLINMGLILIMLFLLRWGRVDLSRLKIYLPLIFTVALFMFSIVLIFPGSNPEYVPIQIGPIKTYYQPFRWAFASYWRLIAMLFGTILYFSTNRERDMLVAMRGLRLPFAASYVVGLSIRAAGMFLEDFHTIREAEQARGLDTASMALSDRAKLYVMYLVPLFSIALRRADEISNALYARGYTISGTVPTGKLRADYVLSRYTMRPRDWIAIGLMVLVFVAVAVAQLRFGLFRLDNAPPNIASFFGV